MKATSFAFGLYAVYEICKHFHYRLHFVSFHACYFDHISSDPLDVPSLMVDRVTTSAVKYQVRRNDDTTNALISGYEVIRFGVPMIGKVYLNTGGGRSPSPIPAVPGVQYRITAWALIGSYGGGRSAEPAVEYATTGETRKTVLRMN